MNTEHMNAQVPPHSVEAEQSVLGGLLMDNLSWDTAAELLSEFDFYLYEHRLIFAAIARLVQRGRPADVVTVYAQLEDQGKEKAADAGGLSYLNELARSVPSAANMRRYAEIVRDRSVLRKLIAASGEIARAAARAGDRPALQVAEQAYITIAAIGQEATTKTADCFQPFGGLVLQVLDEVQARAESELDEVSGVTTGFTKIDAATSGMQRSDLIVLAARPSMGKTAMAVGANPNLTHPANPVLTQGWVLTA